MSDDSTTVQLGLSHLLITCEELLYPREELSTDRKLMIRHNFETHIPNLFVLLSGKWYELYKFRLLIEIKLNKASNRYIPKIQGLKC